MHEYVLFLYDNPADFADVTRSKPERSLVEGRVNKSGGRNSKGRTTTWQRGGGHKRRYRRVDFRREKQGIPARVAAVEYDPNRSAHLALLHYRDGEKRYILAPNGVRVGAVVVSGPVFNGGSLEQNFTFSDHPDLSAGTWYFQAIFRDPAGGGAGFDTSDAVELTISP